MISHLVGCAPASGAVLEIVAMARYVAQQRNIHVFPDQMSIWGKIIGGPIFLLGLFMPNPVLSLICYGVGLILAAAYLGPSLAVTLKNSGEDGAVVADEIKQRGGKNPNIVFADADVEAPRGPAPSAARTANSRRRASSRPSRRLVTLAQAMSSTRPTMLMSTRSGVDTISAVAPTPITIGVAFLAATKRSGSDSDITTSAYDPVSDRLVAWVGGDSVWSLDLDSLRVAWIGGRKKGEPHYYRVQSPTFLIEYDNTQNNSNHIHSVWRTFDGDWGEDILAAHYAASHS